jgi:hypothetical protein
MERSWIHRVEQLSEPGHAQLDLVDRRLGIVHVGHLKRASIESASHFKHRFARLLDLVTDGVGSAQFRPLVLKLISNPSV